MPKPPESSSAFRDLLENINDLVQSVDPEGRFLYVNRSWKRALGYSDDEIARLHLFDVIHADDHEHCRRMFQRILLGETVSGFEVKLKPKSGPPILLEGSSNCRFEDGRPIATRTIFRDIRAHRRLEDELRSLALVDELTGLRNRRGFYADAERVLDLAREHPDPGQFWLVFADLDGLKSINDQWGHHQGDQALQQVAALLRRTFRDSDVIARIGGDEFLILAAGVQPAGLAPLLKRLESSLADLNAPERRPFELRLSIGTTLVDPKAGRPIDESIARADAAMYRQKMGNRRVPIRGLLLSDEEPG